jgi:anti-sigma factor RsiW
MKCTGFAEILSASVDEELTAAEQRELDEHLNGCEGCRAQFASMRRLKHAVARMESRESPPGAVRARVEALRFPRALPALALKRAWLAAVVILAGALLAIPLVVSKSAPRGAPLIDEVVRDHARSTQELVPPEVASGDALEVARFFIGKVPFAPLAPSLPDTRLVGGRVCRIGGRPAELLLYRCGDKHLSLFVLDRALDVDRCRRSGGYAVCCRQVGSLAIMAVGDFPDDELRRLVTEASL